MHLSTGKSKFSPPGCNRLIIGHEAQLDVLHTCDTLAVESFTVIIRVYIRF